MRVIPLAEVLNLGHKEQVPSFQGKVASIFDRSEGEGEHGPWSFQNILLTEGKTELKVKLKNREEFPKSWKGKAVQFISLQTDKGLTGLRAEQDTYKGKTKIVVICTGSAEVSLAGESAPEYAPESDQEPAEPAPQQDPPATAPERPAKPAESPASHRHPAPSPGSEADKRQAVAQARAYLGKASNAFKLCLAAAAHCAKEANEKYGLSLDSDHIERIAVHFSIRMEREAFVDALPTGPLDNYLPKPAPAPAPAAE